MNPGARGDGLPSVCSRSSLMAEVCIFFSFILLWMMAWARDGEVMLTIIYWEESAVVDGSDVDDSLVVSDGADELVESLDVDGSVGRSFPRNGRAEIMSLNSNSVSILLRTTNAKLHRLTPLLYLKPPSTISEESRCWVSANSERREDREAFTTSRCWILSLMDYLPRSQ